MKAKNSQGDTYLEKPLFPGGFLTLTTQLSSVQLLSTKHGRYCITDRRKGAGTDTAVREGAEEGPIFIMGFHVFQEGNNSLFSAHLPLVEI